MLSPLLTIYLQPRTIKACSVYSCIQILSASNRRLSKYDPKKVYSITQIVLASNAKMCYIVDAGEMFCSPTNFMRYVFADNAFMPPQCLLRAELLFIFVLVCTHYGYETSLFS